jgi:ketosteroid isomerase-like protein
MTPSEWIDEYIRAWHEADAEAAGRLFTDDAIYCWHPLQPAAVGREGVEDYWRNVTATQQDQQVRFGSPVVSGNKVAVEFWTTLRNSGDEVTLAGCMLLRFGEDGRCEELREYWFMESGMHSPSPYWGR